LAFNEDAGGALAMARQSTVPEILPVRMPSASDEAFLRGYDLGTLTNWTYPYPRNRFRLTTRKTTVWGTTWGYHYPIPIPVRPLDEPGPRFVDKGPDVEPQIDTRPGVQPQFPTRS